MSSKTWFRFSLTILGIFLIGFAAALFLGINLGRALMAEEAMDRGFGAHQGASTGPFVWFTLEQAMGAKDDAARAAFSSEFDQTWADGYRFGYGCAMAISWRLPAADVLRRVERDGVDRTKEWLQGSLLPYETRQRPAFTPRVEEMRFKVSGMRVAGIEAPNTELMLRFKEGPVLRFCPGRDGFVVLEGVNQAASTR
jgi:hypothetical protein